MNFHSDEWIMNNLKEHYDEACSIMKEDKIVGVFAQGSMNYGLDYEKSDVDTKCIVLPSFDDIVLGKKMVSYTHVRKNDEHIDLKDIRAMFQTFKKQNINFLEILFTKYFILNPDYTEDFLTLMAYKEDIAHWNTFAAVNCMSGMSKEKVHALEHPYPAWKEHIEKYGYSNKELHHIIRMNEFIKRYVAGECFEDCLISKNTEYLIKIKAESDFIKLEDARKIAKTLDKETHDIKERYMNDNILVENKTANKEIQECLVKILKKKLRKEI